MSDAERLYNIKGEVKKVKSVIDNRGETHEILLILVTCCSLITCRRFARLEKYKNKLKGQFIPY
ncbi:hypothetical protein C2W59_02484 [Bacillus pumilus]|nr:hypothetical protein C2W59_02484 [Bacillus pumilus]